VDRKREEEICELWNKQIIHARHAKADYTTAAIKGGRYYRGPNHEFIFDAVKPPDFQVTINKVYELVSIFGPLLYAQNPVRSVEPRSGVPPEIAFAMGRYLNYTPGEFGLKAYSKAAIDDGLINGRGAMFTGPDRRSGLVVSKAEASKNILIDPSTDVWYEGQYVLRFRRDVPLWEIAERFGEATAKRYLDPGSDGGVGGTEGEGYGVWSGDSGGGALDAEQKEDAEAYETPRVSYIEVWSKMGIGLRAKKSEANRYALGTDKADNVRHLAFAYDPAAKFILGGAKWPIPYWADAGKHSWPCSFFDPAENSDPTWPISPILPAMGEQMFLDWGWSFALGAVKVACRSLQVCGTELDAKIVAALKGNQSHVVITTEMSPDQRKDILQSVTMPQLNPALIQILQEVELLFEKRTGLYEILYGQSSRQMRSATEASVKAEFSRLRIDDVIDRVEDWQSEIARKEAIGARYKLDSPQMAPIIGPELAQAWDFYKPGDFKQALREYTYTVQAGSMRKRTPQYRAEVAEKALGIGGERALMVGDLKTYNALWMEWLSASGVPNPERFQLTATPPPEALGQKPQKSEAAPPPAAPEIMAVENGQPVMGNPQGAA